MQVFRPSRHWRRIRHFIICGAGAAVVLSAACSEPPDPRLTNFEVRGKDGVAKYDPQTGRLKRLDIDHNRDGRIETFSYWDGPRVLRIEIDADSDDRIDRWEHYDDTNKLVRVGSSSRDDGVEDTWTYPDTAGQLARVESDTNRDGVVDKRETYSPTAGSPAARVLSMVDLDIDGSGQPRLRLHYAPGGTFERTEVVR